MLPLAWSGLDFPAFAARRQGILALHRGAPEFIDAGNANLYDTLARFDPARFGPLIPSTHPRAAYRCHLAEAFLAHLSLPTELSSRTLVSPGVRISLSLVFKHLSRARSHAVWLPGDVYPVYGALAQEAGLSFDRYPARSGLPWARLESHSNWVLLVCDPLKPWGTRLLDDEIDQLVDTARATGSVVLIDGAYDLHPSPRIRAHLLENAPLAFLGSLSKGWLAPMRGGVVLTSQELATAWRERFQRAGKDETVLRQAYAALDDYPDRPEDVARLVDASRTRLVQRLGEFGLTLQDPGHGYFLVCDRAPDELAALGILGMPASVFGSDFAGTVLSSLGQVQVDG